MTPEDFKEHATALLATVKKLMTGREIEACEWTRSAEFEDDYDEYYYSSEPFYDDEDDESGEELSDMTGDKICCIERLMNQFPREISNYINSRQKAQARRATQVFSRSLATSS